MVITCPSCSARYRLSEDKIKGRGAKITCPKCSHVFVVFSDPAKNGRAGDPAGTTLPTEGVSTKQLATTTGAFKAVLQTEDVPEDLAGKSGQIRVVAPGARGRRRPVATVDAQTREVIPPSGASDDESEAPERDAWDEPADGEVRGIPTMKANDLNFRDVGIKTWKVKVAIGLIYDFSDIATLKKYLGDKKVTPDDLISHNNHDWTRIGAIDDLDAHFIKVWQEAKAGGGMPEAPKPKRAVDTGNSLTAISGSFAAAGGSLATASGTFGAATRPPANTSVPGAYGGAGASARRKTKKPVEEAKSNNRVLIAVAALILLGGGAFFALRPPADKTGPVQTPTTKVDDIGELSASEQDEIARKLAEDLKRQQEELAAGGGETTEGGEEPGDDRERSLEERIAAGELEVVRNAEPARPQATPNFRPTQYQPPQGQLQAGTGGAQAESAPAETASTGDIQTRKAGHAMWLKLARNKLSGSDYGAAEKAALKATSLSPDCAECWNVLGEARNKLNKPKEAAEAFAKAEALAAGSSRATNQ